MTTMLLAINLIISSGMLDLSNAAYQYATADCKLNGTINSCEMVCHSERSYKTDLAIYKDMPACEIVFTDFDASRE